MIWGTARVPHRPPPTADTVAIGHTPGAGVVGGARRPTRAGVPRLCRIQEAVHYRQSFMKVSDTLTSTE